MESPTISFETDTKTAQAYQSASAREQRQLNLLLSLRLRELTSRPPRSLPEIMDEIGREAEAQGLTPEHLQSLLRDV